MNARAPKPHRPPLHWSARLSAWERQAVAVPAAVVVALAVMRMDTNGAEVPWLAGWLAYSLSYLAIAWHLVARLDPSDTHRRSQSIDPGAGALFLLVTVAACASVVAVALAVETSRTLQGLARWAHLALAIGGLAASWLLLQTVFALHYAPVYYAPNPLTGA